MTTLIIYNTSTGFTLKYANWIQEEVPCELVSYKDRGKVNLSNYDTIIFASSLHAGKIKGIKWFKEKVKNIQDKKLIVLTTGAMPVMEEEIEKVFEENMSDIDREHVKTFYVESGLNYDRMCFIDRVLMYGLKKFLKKTEGEDSIMYKTVSSSYDHCSKDNLNPLFMYLKTSIKNI